MIVAGCGDGTVRVFDCRTPPKYTFVFYLLKFNVNIN